MRSHQRAGGKRIVLDKLDGLPISRWLGVEREINSFDLGIAQAEIFRP